MKKFIISAMSEPDGTGSIKRVVFLVLIILFCVIFMYCHITKTNPFEILLNDLRTFIIYMGGLIFGGNVVNAVKEIKVTQSNNNATVGEATPPADTTSTKQ
jgi:hypothetical protein